MKVSTNYSNFYKYFAFDQIFLNFLKMSIQETITGNNIRKKISINFILNFLYVCVNSCKDVYVNSFFPRTARLWNSLTVECFPLIYDLNGFESKINRHLLL